MTCKAPIQVFGIEGRYATALYSAATKEKKLDAVEKELTGFRVGYSLHANAVLKWHWDEKNLVCVGLIILI